MKNSARHARRCLSRVVLPRMSARYLNGSRPIAVGVETTLLSWPARAQKITSPRSTAHRAEAHLRGLDFGCDWEILTHKPKSFARPYERHCKQSQRTARSTVTR